MKPDIQQQFFSADENRRRVTFVTFANRVRYGAIITLPAGQRIRPGEANCTSGHEMLLFSNEHDARILSNMKLPQ